jgi:hypothetical protein
MTNKEIFYKNKVEIESQIEEGRTFVEIAKNFGMNKNLLHQLCKKNNLKSKSRYLPNGYKQKVGFLEVIETIKGGKVRCKCHNCGNICVVVRAKVKTEHSKSCGCLGFNRKICKKCKFINHGFVKACKNCGYLFDNSFVSVIETHPHLLDEYDFDKNKIDIRFLPKCSDELLWWKCKLGHSYQTRLHKKTCYNTQCPICKNKEILVGFNDLCTTNPELCEELLNIEDGKKYTFGSSKKLEWKCKKCDHVWLASICNRIKGRSCPKCNRSYGEKAIEYTLLKYCIKYNPEQGFEGCRYKNPLKFDFYLPDYNLCIEFQGLQHYPGEYTKSRYLQYKRHTPEELKLVKKRDGIKKRFCKKNNINILYIKYSQLENVENILIKELNLV